MILIHSSAHEQDRKTLWEDSWGCGPCERGKGLEPRQGHGDSRAAENGTSGNAVGAFRGSIRHLINLSGSPLSYWRIHISSVQELRASDNYIHQRSEAVGVLSQLALHALN